MHWALTLSDYSFSVEYRKGSENANADALSRLPRPGTAPPEPPSLPDVVPVSRPYDRNSSTEHRPIPSAPFQIAAIVAASKKPLLRPRASLPEEDEQKGEDERKDKNKPARFSYESEAKVQEIYDAQYGDPTLKDLMDYLRDRSVPNSMSLADRRQLERRAARHTLDPDSKLLYCLRQPEYGGKSFLPFHRRLVVPKGPLRDQLLKLFHDDPFGGHLGVTRTFRRICLRYAWEGMYEDIRHYVSNCDVCKRAKAKRVQENRTSPYFDKPTRPFEVISVDHIGPFHNSEDMRWALVIVDLFTGWAITHPVESIDHAVTSRVILEHVYCQHGAPRHILCDNAFNGQIFIDAISALGTVPIFASPYHPQTNGLVERTNGTLKQVLRALCLDEVSATWVLHLPYATFAYNTSPRELEGISPFFALYGRDAYLPGELNLMIPKTNIPASKPREAFTQELFDRMRSTIRWTRECFDARRIEALREKYPGARVPVYTPSDIVYLREYKKQQEFGAFVPRFNGPLVVKRRIGQVNYLVEPHPDNRNKRLKGTRIVHIDDLKFGNRDPRDPPPSIPTPPAAEPQPSPLPSISFDTSSLPSDSEPQFPDDNAPATAQGEEKSDSKSQEDSVDEPVATEPEWLNPLDIPRAEVFTPEPITTPPAAPETMRVLGPHRSRAKPRRSRKRVRQDTQSQEHDAESSPATQDESAASPMQLDESQLAAAPRPIPARKRRTPAPVPHVPVPSPTYISQSPPALVSPPPPTSQQTRHSTRAHRPINLNELALEQQSLLRHAKNLGRDHSSQFTQVQDQRPPSSRVPPPIPPTSIPSPSASTSALRLVPLRPPSHHIYGNHGWLPFYLSHLPHSDIQSFAFRHRIRLP